MVSIVGLNLALFLSFFHLGTVAYAFTCDEDGFYSNPDECMKFVSCSKGQPTEFDCPKGTSFHADRGVCDTTDLSKCATTKATSAPRRAALPDMDSEEFGQQMVELLKKYKPCENHSGDGSSTQNPSDEVSEFTEKDGGSGEKTTTRGDRHSTTTSPRGSTDSQGSGGSSKGSTPSGGYSSTQEPEEVTDGDHHPIRNYTTPNPGNPSSEQPDQSSTRAAITSSPLPPPTCPACPEKTCPVAPSCPSCPVAPSCPSCPTAQSCPGVDTQQPRSVCDDGWKYFEASKSCYFVGTDTRMNNQAAQTACKNQGGMLASIHSEAENNFVLDAVKAAAVTDSFNPWIGVYRIGPFKNATNMANLDATPLDYNNFVDPPGNFDGNEFCTEFFFRNPGAINGAWNDINCLSTRPMFVCKKAINPTTPTGTCPPPPAPSPSCPACPTAAACPAAPTCPPPSQCPTCPVPTEKVCPTVAPCPTTTPTPSKPTCDVGWKHYAATKSCYFLGAKLLSSVDAQKACKDQGATLASIHSEAENTFIFDYVKSSPAPVTPVWIGVFRNGPNNTNFDNYDGTPLDYTKWGPGEPNNKNEFCVEMFVNATNGPDGFWNDRPCEPVGPIGLYACKKPMNQ